MSRFSTTGRRRLLIACLSTIFAGACVWRVFHFPYRREALLLAVPPGAAWAAEQPNLAAAWRAAAENPLVKASLAAAGVKEEDLDRVLAGNRIDRILGPLASRNTVAAYVPESAAGHPQGPAWIAASWVGFRSPVLRWRRLDEAMGRSAIKRRLKPGVNMWTRTVTETGEPWFISVCVIRGAVYACLSKDPFGVQHIAFRVNRGSGMAPFLTDIAASLPPEGSLEQRGWFLAPWKTGTRAGTEPVQYSLSAFDDGSAVCALRLSHNALTVAPAPMPAGWEGAAGLLGDRPCAFLALNREQLDPILDSFLKKGAATFGPLLSQSPAGAPAFACLVAGVDGNRVMGLKFPGLVAGCRTGLDPEGLYARVMDTLDRLNGDNRLRLIPRRMRDGARSWIRIESSDSGVLAGLREGETPAVAVVGGWLVFAGTEALLRAVLDGSPPGSEQPWQTLLLPGGSAPALWMDAGPACRSLRDGVAVLTLLAIASGDTEAARAKRRRLDRAKIWLQYAQNAGSCTVRMEPEGIWTKATIEANNAGRTERR